MRQVGKGRQSNISGELRDRAVASSAEFIEGQLSGGVRRG